MLETEASSKKIEFRQLILLAVLAALALTSLYSYLLFHSLVEIISVVVASTIFIVTWAARRSLKNSYLLLLGVIFLYIGLFDTLHALAYKGMPVFTGYDANLPTQLWIASRYMLGAAFLVAPFFMRRQIHFGLALGVAGVISGILLVTIFTGIFPACYIEGVGLTPFKIYSEYVIAFMLIIGLFALQRNQDVFDANVSRWLKISLVLNILAGVAFTNYVSVFDFANLAGHLLKTAAYYFLFHAIVETGFYQPFNLLLRDLKQSESSLLQAQSELEKRVEERTYQLAQANLDLRSEISERLKVEEALRQSETLFRTVFEKTSLGIIVVGMDGVIQAANHAMETILESPREEIIGKHIVDITYSEDVPASRELVNRLASGEMHSHEIDKRYINQRGEPVWAHLSITTVYNEDGSPRFIIGIIKDIRESRRSAEELREVQRRLMNSKEEERLRLARDLHDGPVQELLAAVYQVNEILRDKTPEEQEQLKSLLDQICKVNHSLRSITGELRPQALAPFGLEKAIRSHTDVLRQNYPGLAIHLDLMPDGQEFPETTRMALYRVYRQSMDNIIQHANATRATVQLSFDAVELRLEISDNGQGFQPPHGWIQLVRGGHFGLAGMSERVEALGGTLTIHSTPGSGTLIDVRVPRSPEGVPEDQNLQGEKI